MELIPVVELGVAEAYAILAGRFGQSDLPPLEAIENEDWGRDHLLSRFESIPVQALAEAGLTRDEGWDLAPGGGPRPGRRSAAPGPDLAGGAEVGGVVGHDPDPEAGLDRHGEG